MNTSVATRAILGAVSPGFVAGRLSPRVVPVRGGNRALIAFTARAPLRSRLTSLGGWGSAIEVDTYLFDGPINIEQRCWEWMELGPYSFGSMWTGPDGILAGQLLSGWAHSVHKYKLAWSDCNYRLVSVGYCETWQKLLEWWMAPGRHALAGPPMERRPSRSIGSTPETRVPRAIKLMADYGMYSLWDISEEDRGNIDPRELPLAESICERIEVWSDWYNRTFDEENPGDSGWETPQARHAFDLEGREIWSELGQQLGPSVKVEYFSENLGRLLARDQREGPGDSGRV
jgi:hypothetical protein